jgi:putative membrane-bound dehydrogenase-like protein
MNQSILFAVVFAALATATFAQDSIDRDYSGDLKRIPPTEPAEALKTFEVVPGYKIELCAAEPMVASPVAASFDEDNRLYVAEMRDYSEQDKEHLGRVRLLTDRNADGKFDDSVVFAEGLSWPTAIICYDGGVFVGAAPDIFYLKDTNGDGKADVKRVVFTGFGRGNVQGLLNSFMWGLDNRIHVAVSTAGANLQRVDKDGKPTGKPLSLRGRDFSFDPRNPDDFIATSGGGQHGMSFDDWGRKFVCSNSDHIQLIMLEDADIARNPYMIPPNPRISIAIDGPQADVFRISPVEPWREIRTRLRVQGIVPGPIEGGGRAAGYFTGATGVTIYRGNAWPEEDRGLAIVGDVGSNLIHRKRLEPHGLELRAKRIDDKREFVASRDNWFRPVQFLNAPDGALYVIDMYREVIEHPASLPPVIKKHLDLTSGRDRGRIYRIVPADFKQPKLKKLSKATTEDLVRLLGSDNGWHRDTAARLLYESSEQAARSQLHKFAEESQKPLTMLHIMYALDGLEGDVSKEVALAERMKSDDLRVHAIRLKHRHGLPVRIDPDEKSLQVIFAAALARPQATDLQNMEEVTGIIRRNPSDRWIRTALLISTGEHPGELLAHLLFRGRKSFGTKTEEREWVELLMKQVIRRDSASDFSVIGGNIAGVAKTSPEAYQCILDALVSNPLGNELTGYLGAVEQTPAKLRELLAPRIEAAWTTAESPEAAEAERVKALTTVRFDKDAPLRALKLFDSSQPTAVQIAALDAATHRTNASAPGLVLKKWPTLSPAVRAEVIRIFLERTRHTETLLMAIKEGDIPIAEIAIADLDRLRNHRDPTLRDQARQILPAGPPKARRGDIVASYTDALKLPGDKVRGEELFKKQCSSCHKLGGVGHEIGPNLAAMKARGAEAILTNVLDPNREVNPQYVTYAVTTKDGRTLSGMISAETANSISLKNAENKEETVLRIDIEELKSTGLSLMPEGLEKNLDKQQLADVIEYLMKQ